MTRSIATTSKRFKGETFKYQDSLPSLPVPSIESTKARYLKSIKPFVSSQEHYQKHEALVEDFFKTQGPVLHERLLALQAKSRNWLATYWDDYAYLQYTDPIVPYVSYFFGHRDLPFELATIGKNRSYKAVAIIDKVLDFVELLQNESLPPEVIRGTPFCMKSFQMMFNNCRIPFQLNQDSNVFYSITDPANAFIIVVKDNHYFKLFTHTPDGSRLPNSGIYKQLLEIIKQAENLPVNKDPIGILTTAPRNDWFNAHTELVKDPINVASLEDIRKSTFVLALDNDKPVTYEDRAHYAWHGNGINRFFDKSIQFFVAENGYSAFIAEHSRMDGTPTLLLNEYVGRELRKVNPAEFLKSLNVDHSASKEFSPVHLKFNVTPPVKNAIVAAKENFKFEIDNHDLKVLHYNKYGKNQIKQFKVSPDAFIQMVIQLGFYKLNKYVWPTYEAASTRKYFGGRTETTRSVSEESLTFVKNWDDPTVSDAQRVKDFNNAIKSHVNYNKAASNGEGCDRHFLGLKFQLQDGEKPHALFADPLFNYSSTWLISTSQLSSNLHDAYGWSEVNPIGWGLAYQVNDDYLHINICTRKSSGNKSEQLWYYLKEAADELYEVLLKESQKAKL